MKLFKRKSKFFLSDLVSRVQDKLIPIGIHFNVTYKCNLRCRHCYVAQDNKRRELDFKEVCSILDQLRDAGCIHITFTGGELFVRPDALDILSYARKKGIMVAFITNATLITKRVAKRLKRIKVSAAAVSLYGASPDSYNKVAGNPQAFKKAIEGMRLLVDSVNKVFVNVIILKYNYNELAKMLALAKEVTPHTIKTGYLFYAKNNGSCEPFKHEISRIQSFIYATQHYRDPKSIERMARRTGVGLPNCGAGRSSYTISPYGDVTPCVISNKYTSNLREKSLYEIIHNDKDFDKLRPPKILDPSELEECKNCNLRRFCNVCWAIYDNQKHFGNLKGVCRRAEYYKELYQFLKLYYRLKQSRRFSSSVSRSH